MATRGQATLSLTERLEVVYEATHEVIKPSLFGVAIITLVYLPIFSLTGIEGKMFHPMAITVVMALLSAMVLSNHFCASGRRTFHHWQSIGEAQSDYARRGMVIQTCATGFTETSLARIATLAFSTIAGTGWLASTMGSEFIPQLDEGDVTVQALRTPGTSLQQSIEMQDILERRLLEFPEVQEVFSRIGTPEIASDPMPPSISETPS